MKTRAAAAAAALYWVLSHRSILRPGAVGSEVLPAVVVPVCPNSGVKCRHVHVDF